MKQVSAAHLEPDMLFCMDDLAMRQVIRADGDTGEPGIIRVHFRYLFSQTTEWIKFDTEYTITIYGKLIPAE